MENIIILIRDSKIVTSPKSGKDYMKVETDNGMYSVFDEDVQRVITASKGKHLNVAYKSSADGKFKNIQAIDGIVEADGVQKAIGKPSDNKTFKKHEDTPPYTPDAPNKRDTSFYAAYSKDIFIELIKHNTELKIATPHTDTMDKAISLVRQAKDSFK